MLQILPAIDLRNGRCVRLQQGDYQRETVFSDNPAEMARLWEQGGGDRLHLVDLDGAKAGRPVNLDALRSITAAVSFPCELGGGLRDDAAVELVLNDLKIDRAIIGTAALKNPAWFASLAERFPNRIALGLDTRDGLVATEGWLDVSTTSAFDLANQFAGLPLAAVIYTNIANDGMMQGIDPATLEDLERLADRGFPVIASGGVTSLDDIRRLAEINRRQPQLVGAIIGRALYDGAFQLAEAVAVSRSSQSA